jgi:hypothetical protein
MEKDAYNDSHNKSSKELEKLLDEFIENQWHDRSRWVKIFGIDHKKYLKWALKRKVTKTSCVLIKEDRFARLIEHPLNYILCCIEDEDGCIAELNLKKYRIEYNDLLTRKRKAAYICMGKVLYNLGLVE